MYIVEHQRLSLTRIHKHFVSKEDAIYSGCKTNAHILYRGVLLHGIRHAVSSVCQQWASSEVKPQFMIMIKKARWKVEDGSCWEGEEEGERRQQV